MSIKSILCLYNGEPSEADALDTAMELARQHGARLRVLQVCLPLTAYPELCAVVMYGHDITGEGPSLDGLVKANRTELETAEAAVEAAARNRQLPFDKSGTAKVDGLARVSFASVTSMPGDCLPCEGRATDLIVAGRTNGDADLAAVLTCVSTTGRPTLVMPSSSGERRAPPKPKSAVVAWDGSLEAARALGYALPLLDGGVSVELVSIAEHGEVSKLVNVDGVKAWLASHGITPRMTMLENHGPSVGRMLLDHCEAGNADMLVMGAYGHDHIKEFIMGSTTGYILKHATLPLLLAA